MSIPVDPTRSEALRMAINAVGNQSTAKEVARDVVRTAQEFEAYLRGDNYKRDDPDGVAVARALSR